VRGRPRWIAAGIVALSIAALSGFACPPAVAASPAQREATSAPQLAAGTADPAVQAYGGCLKGRKAGDLLILVDESGSLRSTDRDGGRVSAATYLLNQLNGLADRTKVQLDVQVAGFASEFSPETDWTQLSTENLPRLTAAVEAFRSRNTGFDTDYWMALEGARRALSDRPLGGGDAGRCQAIAWFTDGELDIEPRTNQQELDEHGATRPYAEGVQITSQAAAAEAKQEAVKALCRGGGLADQLRSSGVVTFAVGLAAPPKQSPPKEAPQDFGLLRSIATGEPDKGVACGDIVHPTPGSFYLASNIDDLLFDFDELVPPDVQIKKGICPAGHDECAERHEFVLDESIDGVHILGSASKPDIQAYLPGIQVYLIGPDGSVHPLDDPDHGRTAKIDLGGTVVSYSWQLPGTLTVDLLNTNHSAAGWSGLWALTFVDPKDPAPTGTSRSNIHIWANVIPAWTNRSEAVLTSGSVVPNVRLGLTKTDGSPVDPARLRGEATLSAVLLGPDGKETRVAAGLGKTVIGDPVKLDLTNVPPGAAVLRLDLDLTTAGVPRPGGGPEVPGTVLAPQRVDIPLKVEAPVGYPSLPVLVDFGTVEFRNGTGDKIFELTAALPFTGPGCVWLDPASPLKISTLPDRVSGIAIRADGPTSGASCVAAKQGEQRELTLRLSGEGAGNGTLSGGVLVSSAPLGQLAKGRTTSIAFTADLRKPLQPFRYWVALLGSILLGIVIPIGLLYLARWFTRRIPDEGLYAKKIPVFVDGRQVLRDGGAAEFALRDSDLNELVPIRQGGERSRLDVAGVALRPRVGWAPFGAGYVSVVVPHGDGELVAGASSTDSVAHGRHKRARLPLAVHNTWVLLHDLNGPESHAEVLVLAGSQLSGAQRDKLAKDVAERVPDLLRRLRGLAETRKNGPEPPPSPPGDTYGSGGWSPASPPPRGRYGPSSGADAGRGARATYGQGNGADPGPGGGAGYGQDDKTQPRYGPDTGPGYGPDAYGGPPWEQ
jgi:hypothetical protein